MKPYQQYLLPAAFLIVLLVLGSGVWLFSSLSASNGTKQGSSGSKDFFSSLFPFGSPQSPPSTDGGSNTEPTGLAPEVRKVSEVPVAASTFVIDGGKLFIRYIERETGHVQQTPADSLETVRISNTTIPAVAEAAWINASTTILRFLSDNGGVENFVGSLSTSTSEQTLTGQFINRYVRLSVASSSILGVIDRGTGASIETVSLANGKVETLFTSPIRSWVPLTAANTNFIYSGPAGGMLGTLFELQKGQAKKVLELPGLLAVVSTTSQAFIVSGGTLNTAFLGLATRSGEVTNLGQRTLAHKCVFMRPDGARILCAVPVSIPPALYPDDWLLGKVHTNDELWLIRSQGEPLRAADLGGFGPFDIERIVVSPDERYALFINKNDQSLWSVKLALQTQ